MLSWDVSDGIDFSILGYVVYYLIVNIVYDIAIVASLKLCTD